MGNKEAEKNDISLQRKAFMLTLWPRDDSLEDHAILAHAELLVESYSPACYAIGQLEYSCGDKNKHIQMLLRTNKRVRGRTVKGHFQGDIFKPPHIENVINLANSKEYCSKDVCDKCGEGTPNCARVEDTKPLTYGIWVPPKKAKSLAASELKTCAQLITEGYSAEYIAFHHPKMFLRYGTKIIGTIHYRELYKEREEFLPKEKDNEEE